MARSSPTARPERRHRQTPLAYAGRATRPTWNPDRAPRRRRARHGIVFSTALSAAAVLAACGNGSSGTAGSTTTTAPSPAAALANLKVTLRDLDTATAALKTSLVTLEGSALNGGEVSTTDVEAATAPVSTLLQRATSQLGTARPGLPAGITPQANSLAGSLAKAVIDLNATKGIASAGSSTLISAYLTDVTELQNSEQTAMAQFLAAVGTSSG